MRQPPRADRLDLSARSPDTADVVELDEYPTRLDIGLSFPRLECASKVVVPPECLEGHRGFRSPAFGLRSPVPSIQAIATSSTSLRTSSRRRPATASE